MKLEFKEQFKSISEFNPIEIEDFTILTGVNGSGKSHLLEAIQRKKVITHGFEDSNNIIYFNYENFKLEDESMFDNREVTSGREAGWQFFETTIKNEILSYKSQLGGNYEKIVNIAREKNKSIWDLHKEDFNDDSIYELFQKNYKQPIINYFQRTTSENRRSHLVSNQLRSIISLAKTLPYSMDEITEEDFSYFYKPIILKNNFLPLRVGRYFFDYHVLHETNFIRKFENQERGLNKSFLSDSDFEKRYGPKPWEIVNEILETFDTLNYKVNSPTGTSILDHFALKLLHTKNKNLEIGFGQLSSGEKILMALVFSIYKTSFDNLFPEILLLDEIDTSLHPSMIQNLLDVIEQTFLKRGVKVILVTHSPTTIALAPEETIFVMEKYGQDRIKKKDKREALSILTEGYATLDEGLVLLDQISKKEFCIFTEGNNTEYIKKALDFFGEKSKDRIEIMSGIKDRSGDSQLKTLFDFFSKMPHNNKILFVLDCDVKTLFTDTDNTFSYIFSKNDDNPKVKKGIENLFPEKCFTDDFYYVGTGNDDGGAHISLNKKEFKNHMISNGTKEDFKNFMPLIERINNIIGN